jgi:hypothetical protein
LPPSKRSEAGCRSNPLCPAGKVVPIQISQAEMGFPPGAHFDTNPAMSDAPYSEPGRGYPAKGVHLTSGEPNWVFLTVNTKERGDWLAQTSVQKALHGIWKESAKAWLVGDYLLMPDHLHLFCAPFDLKFSIERWMAFWKDRFAKTHRDTGTFQTGWPASPTAR